MKFFISCLLIGALAIVASNPDSPNQNASQEALLSSIFPSGNVPVDPSSKSEKSVSESDSQAVKEDIKKSDSLNTPRVITQIPGALEKDQGRVYSFQVPLNNEDGGEQSTELSDQRQYLYYQPSSVENDGNNANEDYNVQPLTNKPLRKVKKFRNKNKKFKNNNKDFSSIEDFQRERKVQGGQSQLKKTYGNETQAIQGAGSGFLNVAHHNPEGHYGPQPEVIHEVVPPEALGHAPPHQPHPHHPPPVLEHHEHGPHEAPHHGGHPGAHPGGHPGGHEIGHHPHHLPPLVHHELPKPLKPSVVHRDPHDTYQQHDKLRTQDKDHLHHLGPTGHGFEPYHYDMKIIPECAYKNKHFYNLTFCLEDHAYPLETILWAIHQYGDFAHQLISDVTYQSADNLVSGLTRAEEEGYTYKHYFGATHSQHTHLEQYKPPYHGYTYKTDYFKKGGYICPSDIYYGRPRRAMNTYGQWKVIVNVDHVPKHLPHAHHHGNSIHKKREVREAFYPHKGHGIHHKPYTQTLRLEQCIYPNAPCSFIDPHFHSKCIQKHNFVRLVAWTAEEGLHVDTFKLPIACSCHIPQPIHFYHESGHHQETHGHVVPPVNHYGHGHGKK